MFEIIKCYIVKEQMWISGISVFEFAKVLLAINSITLNRCGPCVTLMNLALQAFKQFIFVIRYKNVL
jgi:hypothetical protein